MRIPSEAIEEFRVTNPAPKPIPAARRWTQGCANPTPPLMVTCPLGGGVSPAILSLWNGQGALPNGKNIPAYPHANTAAAVGSDGLNVLGYSFAAPQPTDLNTHLVRFDDNVTANGNHRLCFAAT